VQTGRIAGDPDVGRHGEGQPGANRHSVDSGDDGLVGVESQREEEPSDPALLVEESLLLGQAGVDLGAIVRPEVEAGTKRIAVPGDRDDAHGVVIRRPLHGADDAPAELGSERILAFGPG